MLSRTESDVILVGGYKGNKDTYGVDSNLRECCWKLYSEIYDVNPRAKWSIMRQLQVVVNNSDLRRVSRQTVNELRELLLETPLHEDGITRILFSHSHGAIVVYAALDGTDFPEFLKMKGYIYPYLLSSAIQEHLAIFNFGGSQIIPKCYAKISFNMYLEDDTFGKLAQRVFGDDVFSSYNKITYRAEESSGFLRNLFSSSSRKQSHLLRKYVDNEEILDTIRRKLGIRNNFRF